MKPTPLQLSILAMLVVLMAGSRASHFGPLPDASWAVFFIGGFYLQAHVRWAFPLLMALAVLVDYAVIAGSGQSFWQHYCVSPAYWCLIPAYFSMWAGGAWLRRREVRVDVRALGLLALSLVLAVAACQFISQGSFYWLSGTVASPTLAGWWDNYVTWLWPYMATAARYVALAAGLHVAATLMAQHRGRLAAR